MSREYRTKVNYKFEAEGKHHEPVTSFSFIREELHQYKDARMSDYATDHTNPETKKEILADGLTRQHLVGIISDAAEMLSFAQARNWDNG